ncbi:uncharacterized protein LY89DRAFT_705802 [Mollisia scopiformis]|uniref:Uncharacterized protein n=1 Tax=Mollisia scopiformis TaxID=149040 RepID=A0A194XIL3_MOLSC|nr:uncharacterized protein LY89DRAFT_705802 [Mollisia scopiformis]KUJ19971.1 hypothetical protein LY89DRAFT_705802 [Mollisia scopiformis]
MDPFSIIAGTAGLADVCLRLAIFLKHAHDGFRVVDQELEELSEEITSLRALNDLAERTYKEESVVGIDPDQQDVLSTNWRATQNTLASCQGIVERIEAILREILHSGNGKHVKLDQVRKWLKQRSKERGLNTLREKLQAHQIALQVSLSAVSIIHSRTSQQESHKSYSDLSASIQSLGADLVSKIDSLKRVITPSERTLGSSIESVKEAVAFAYLNKHFFIPQPVRSIFTGRKDELEQLKNCLTTTPSEGPLCTQKRFVVFGLSGSGKTQFCCKFASENKQSFWGVFWFDASSQGHAEQSFSNLSTIGKVASNPAAVKSWFSSLGPEKPWLLLFDNADHERFPVEEYFPDSNFGTILITTRNPLLKTHGTVGPRYFGFHGLDEEKSIELLLNASEEPKPWKPSSVNSASIIAKAMGYLPLALIHAGATIHSHLCTLENYLEVFEETWEFIRQTKDPNASTPISQENAAIYSTYEVILSGILAKKTLASEDALDLLRIFSFLDRQQIKLSIFFRAASNPEGKAYSKLIPKITRGQALRSIITRLVNLLSQLGHRPVLPRFLSEAHGPKVSYQSRLREGLHELSQLSLISTSSDRGECYSMHAAVHLWARQRPAMTLVEQAVWCQMTATILSRAILLPPLDDTEEEEAFRGDLLSHVRHVQDVELKIQTMFTKNRQSRLWTWPVLYSPITPERLEQLVKFSLVYAQGQRSQLQEAERLQSYAAKVVMQYLGMEHIKTINIMRLLSRTYWQLGQIDEAVGGLKQALDACINVLGRENPETLQIMDSYGSSLWLQGRIQEARKVHAAAVEGLSNTLGSDDVQTLKAMGGLGRAVGKDFDFTEAVSIQSKAFTGLKAKLGPSHSATLEAMDNLAMAYFDRAAFRRGQPGDLKHALELESEVYTVRSEKLGKEHYHTLWAGLNLARIHAIRGETDEALRIFLPGHAAVLRDLGENHFIYLFGELHHGRILMCARRYEEAERILSNVVRSHQENRRGHPDRLLAMFSLIKCRNVLGKDDETATLLTELIEGTKAMICLGWYGSFSYPKWRSGDIANRRIMTAINEIALEVAEARRREEETKNSQLNRKRRHTLNLELDT